ncbi:MAG: YncE family protein, partial [Candidatus Acidiferrales bacterium]
GELLKTLTDLKAPHSLVYRDDLKKLYVVDGGLGKIRMYDGTTYKNAGEIDLREGADSMAYDPATKYMYVVNGGKDANMPNSYLTSVDTTTGKKLHDIQLESNDVEAVVLDNASPRVFVVIRGKNWVDVFNRETLAKLATWPLPKEVDKPTAMILDAKNHRLIIGTRAPGNLVLMDSNTGKVTSMEPAAGMVDNLALNKANNQIYYAATDFLEVFQLQSPNKTGLLDKIPTRFRAKTGIFVPQLKRYYIGLPHHEGKIAELRIYEVS